jgi:hypothetical protein
LPGGASGEPARAGLLRPNPADAGKADAQAALNTLSYCNIGKFEFYWILRWISENLFWKPTFR